MPTPEVRIRILEGSLRCFVMGLLSLIPLFGAGFAINAIRTHFRVWAEDGRAWNPAQAYLRWGFVLAWIGALITLAALGLVLLWLASVQEHGF